MPNAVIKYNKIAAVDSVPVFLNSIRIKWLLSRSEDDRLGS